MKVFRLWEAMYVWAVKKDWHIAQLIMHCSSLAFVKVWGSDERSFYSAVTVPESSPFLWGSGPTADCWQLSCFWSCSAAWMVTSLCFTSPLAEMHACEICSGAPPDISTSNHFRTDCHRQLAVGLSVRTCVQKRIQTQTEQVGPKLSDFSKGIPLQTVPGTTWKAFIPFADNL